MSVSSAPWRQLQGMTCIMCALAAISGCGRSATVPMAGQVTLDGAALPSGEIVLIPMQTNAGPTVGAGISDEGRYEMPASHGPRRGGKYRVEIRSIDPSSGSTKHPLSRGKPVFLDRIPVEYNAESRLELSIPDDASDFQHDFNLTSDVKH